MAHCSNCPRVCGVDRAAQAGFCGAPWNVSVAAVCLHRGEEPPLSGEKGIVNIFFSHCNMRCVYCQNRVVSRSEPQVVQRYGTLEEVVDRVEQLLPQSENMVGLVSPSHYVYVVPELVERIRQRGLSPTVVYNTGGYDSVEALRMVAPYVDVYLPDYKYISPELARRYSATPDYVEVAQRALEEMVYQKGTSLPTDDRGMAYRGVIVRHLVLPGQAAHSVGCLQWIADNLSTRVHVSLMAQYYPPEELVGTLPDELNRTLLPSEYGQVTTAFEELGFTRGWVQELEASASYRPDFASSSVFEEQQRN